jgi:hypothetical protein
MSYHTCGLLSLPKRALYIFTYYYLVPQLLATCMILGYIGISELTKGKGDTAI